MEERNYLLKDVAKADHRLKQNKQFNFIFKKGEKFHSKNFNLFVIKSKYKTFKIGYSINKKEGKANKRNLLKRRLRNIIHLRQLPKDNHNYILQARIGACDLDFKEIEKQIVWLFGKANLTENDSKIIERVKEDK